LKTLQKIIRFFANYKLHAYSFLLLLSTFVWMSLPYNNGLDMTIQKWVGVVRLALPEANKPANDRIIFIDVSRSRYLLPVNADATENDVVVNRDWLRQLYQFIAQHGDSIQYVFNDIMFDRDAPGDSLLRTAIAALGNKFLAINSRNGQYELQRNSLGVRAATASVDLQSGAVYKIPFLGKLGDTLVPYQIYTDLHPHRATTNWLFSWFSGKGISFNTQINDYPLRRNDFVNGEYIKIGLGELVSLLHVAPEIYDQYLKNRFILIGDFENDQHNTYLNKQPGTLILFNAYWHLAQGGQLISFWYLLILYLFLYGIVWLETHKKTVVYQHKLKLPYFEVFIIPVNIITISILLIGFTYVSALLFHVNISIFHLIALFSLIDTVKFFINKLEKRGSSAIQIKPDE
jgi:hypothetical protein